MTLIFKCKDNEVLSFNNNFTFFKKSEVIKALLLWNGLKTDSGSIIIDVSNIISKKTLSNIDRYPWHKNKNNTTIFPTVSDIYELMELYNYLLLDEEYNLIEDYYLLNIVEYKSFSDIRSDMIRIKSLNLSTDKEYKAFVKKWNWINLLV